MDIDTFWIKPVKTLKIFKQRCESRRKGCKCPGQQTLNFKLEPVMSIGTKNYVITIFESKNTSRNKHLYQIFKDKKSKNTNSKICFCHQFLITRN